MDRSAQVARAYSLLFFVAFALSVVMLATDSNLRSDFGTMSSGYFSHWYVVLATAVADLVGGVLLVVVASRTAVRAGVAGSGLLSAIFLGDVLTYKQVGFASASDFAKYLFGQMYYGGDIRYLYDGLLAVYLITFVAGFVCLRWARPSLPPTPTPAP
jgi:hypothetical protein